MIDTHRVAASTVPRASRLAGSPEWCYQTLNLLQESYKHVSTDHKRFVGYLGELREHKAWEKVPVDHPYGSESKMLIAELDKRIDEIEAQIGAIHKDQHAIEAAELDAKTPDLNPAGTNQYSGPDNTEKNVR